MVIFSKHIHIKVAKQNNTRIKKGKRKSPHLPLAPTVRWLLLLAIIPLKMRNKGKQTKYAPQMKWLKSKVLKEGGQIKQAEEG